MFTLHKTVETAAGELITVIHGRYERRSDAEQIGDNLRLLYSWVKAVRVEQTTSDAMLPPGGRRKMAASKSSRPAPQRKIS